MKKNKVKKKVKKKQRLLNEKGIIPAIIAGASIIGLIAGWVIQGATIALDTILKLIQILVSHPLMAYVFVIFIMFGDVAVIGQIVPNGFIGTIISGTLKVFGLNIIVKTEQLLVLIVVFPVAMFALHKSRQLQK